MQTVFCQSCAMPLNDEQLFGTEADGSRNLEYCRYCYADGKFTSDVGMEEMIEICVPHMVETNPALDADKARGMMREFFPTLKRWKQ